MQPMRHRVSLAVDDAGAGFSSLRHIVELAPAMVKLDRSLVAGIAEDGAREAVVTGMVRFAESAGHVLLAEGVETRAELAALRRLGVQLGQGYLLGRPVPVRSTQVQRPDSTPRRARPSVASRPSRNPSRSAIAAA
jgi:EAL domain-containing protein (putative c-di-GMP-specific phosphodiesterase class I)